MDGRLISILWDSAISIVAGIFLVYLGFVSPLFRASSEQLAPDRWVGSFRIIARIVGPVLCIIAGVRVFADIQREKKLPDLTWHEVHSVEGRFCVLSPKDLTKQVADITYDGRLVRECRFEGIVAPLGFLVSYIDLPASSLKKEPTAILSTELDERIRATGVKRVSNDKPTRIQDYPGIRFKVHNVSGGYFAEGLFLLVKERRYQLAVQYTSESSAPVREKFFSSFQVLDGP
jgi:hypothetical protein